MNRYTLTIVDTTGIQDYIFGTNQLMQNIGASYLVDCASRKWVVENLPKPNNVRVDLDDSDPFTGLTIEDDKLKAEIVYAGGGNTVIIFANKPYAMDFAQSLTHKVLIDAPGLDLVLAHEEFDWDNGKSLGGRNGVVDSVMKKLSIKKANRPVSTPLLGLGVTASCAFTGLPATDEERNQLISSEVKAKIGVGKEANDRLKEIFDFKGYEPAMEFKELGSTFGKSNYIAVVHTDGNGMSNRIKRIQEKFSNSSQNRDYVQEMRSFSGSIQYATHESLQNTIDKLVDFVNKVLGNDSNHRRKLPFRPIVFGGDDVTFVCNGQLGLSLAAHYLKELSSQRLSDEKLAYCRAGIAVVKTHYPFARAYALSEDLCKSTKEYIMKQKEASGEEGLTAIDWHFAVNGLVRNLKEIRDREYITKEGSLLMRPMRLSASENDWKSWELFTNIITKFKDDAPWKDRRNKIKALREALRTGRDEVKHLRQAYGLPQLPRIGNFLDMAEQGWQGENCGYFDAIEAMDFFISLDGDSQ